VIGYNLVPDPPANIIPFIKDCYSFRYIKFDSLRLLHFPINSSFADTNRW